MTQDVIAIAQGVRHALQDDDSAAFGPDISVRRGIGDLHRPSDAFVPACGPRDQSGMALTPASPDLETSAPAQPRFSDDER
jgi:hypothetical protein